MGFGLFGTPPFGCFRELETIRYLMRSESGWTKWWKKFRNSHGNGSYIVLNLHLLVL